MSNDLNVALVLRLVNKLTGPARAAIQQISEVGRAAERVGRAGVEWSNRGLAAADARAVSYRNSALEVAGLVYSIQRGVAPAIEFESAMAGVSKVIDFEGSTGIAKLGEDILTLTSSGALPMAAEGIAAIVEAAGQAGVVDAALPDEEKRAALLAFAETAAKMGVAFDISAEASGQAMAQWRAAMKLTGEESVALGDAINHLSNNMNASAPALVDVIRRQGALAMQAGLTEIEVAALSAAFLSGGASPEVAATALKNFTNALTKGEAMTKRQSAVLAALGIDAVELSKRMQVDAKGAIIDVMAKLQELPAHVRSASLGNLFGEEAKGAIAPLLSNLDNLRGAFELVAEPTQFAGAMLEEYAKQSATTANQAQVTAGYLNALSVTVGSVLLPEINALFASVQPVIESFRVWASENPETIRLIAQIGAGFIALKVAAIALGWPVAMMARGFFFATKAMSTAVVVGTKLFRAFAVLGAVTSRVAAVALKPFLASIRAVAAVALANPFIAAAAAIAAVAYAIYDNWDQVVAYFTDKMHTISAAFEDGFIQGVLTAIAELNPFVFIYEAFDGLIAYLTGFDMHGLFLSLFTFEWADLLPDWRWSDIIPDLPDVFGGGPELTIDQKRAQYAAGSGGRRALGGSVFAGRPYLVGENGPEPFVPAVDGRILPHTALRSEAGGTGAGSVTIGDVHVHAAPGQSAEEIARAVRDELAAATQAPDRALHDGGGL